MYRDGKWQGTKNHDVPYPVFRDYVFLKIVMEYLLCSRHYTKHLKYNS